MARVAIVTGGTRGIGEAISLALKEQGVTVAANYAGNDERAKEFSDRTGIRAFKWDVSNHEACLAGVAPSTRQSGKVKAVTFRWGANKELRDALCDFAGDSRRANPWAADLYDRARARKCDHPHAVRILARAWANIIWRCWQDNTAYDPAEHGGLQRILNQDQQPAAA